MNIDERFVARYNDEGDHWVVFDLEEGHEVGGYAIQEQDIAEHAAALYGCRYESRKFAAKRY